MLRLVEQEQLYGIPAQMMEDGQIGVIISWSTGSYLGKIVQRYKDNLVSLGEESGQSWSNWFDGRKAEDCRVRLLTKKDLLQLS